jgi:fumarate reductase flavoprotein subunit
MAKQGADLVVVGAGLAGISAALRGRELGLDVLLIERSDVWGGWSNSRMSGARYHAAGLSPLVDADRIMARVRTETGGSADPRVTEAWARNCGRSYRWLRAQGIRFVILRDVPVMAPIRPNRRGEVWSGYGSDVAVRRLLRRFTASGGRYLGGHSGDELMTDGMTARGIVAAPIEGGPRLTVTARATVLADGGFQSDLAMLRDVAAVPQPAMLVQRGAGSGMGDGSRMALAAGGHIVEPTALYAHLIHRDGRTTSELRHYPMLDTLAKDAVVIDGSGNRFCDERMGGLAIANRVARLDDPLSAWVVFDRRLWETAGRANQIVAPNPNLLLAGARIERGADVEELATGIGVDATALRQSIDTIGRWQTDAIPQDASGSVPMQAPFFAVPMAVGLTFTMGGIAIGPAGDVETRDGRPIHGLYAAGTTAGGLSGGSKPGYVGGLSIAVTLGMLAAEHAAHGAVA